MGIDFRIIKCKKCDAPLVELTGQKLDRCIQCGYVFDSEKEEKTITTSKPVKSKFSKVHKKSPKIVKKKVSTWVTVVKWYLILAFIIGIFSNFLSL